MSTVPSPTRRASASTAFAFALAVALVTGLLAARDPASGRDAAAELPTIGSLVPDDTLDSRIIALELEGAEWVAAVEHLDRALFDRAETLRRLASSRIRLDEVREKLLGVDQLLDSARFTAGTVDADIAALETVLRERALALFLNHGEADSSALGSATDAVDEARISQLASEVNESQFATRRSLLEQRANLETQLSAFSGRALELRTVTTSLRSAIAVDEYSLIELASEIEAATDVVRRARRNAQIGGMDFSVVALDAYLAAEVLLAEQLPDCGLEWWMIAGIGRVESRHGEIGGRSIRADGRTDSPIIGVVLDGGPGVRAVVDTDGGSLDNDVDWDRAVGPMQFIPETWRIRSRDANGDGIKDPHNIYDAAFTTGRYLCQLGGDLSRPTALRRAYYGYNTSLSYVDSVSGHANRYSELIPEPESGS